MRTIAVEAFKFNELNDKAKQRARQWWREGALHDDWWQPTVEDAKTCMAFLGFAVKDVLFTGFWSQGDGACFTGSFAAGEVQPGKLQEHAPKDAELARIAAGIEELAAAFPNLGADIKHRGRDCHEHSVTFEVEFREDAIGEMWFESVEWHERSTKLEQAEERLKEFSRAAMKWIYRELETEYDYQNADKQVDEAIVVNEYDFTAEGKRCYCL